MLPERDSDGRVVHTWDKCKHPPEALHVDIQQGYLVCTDCALILKENALQMQSTSDGKPLKTVTVRGADSEYNQWRSQELDLVDAMAKLGVLDNEGALKRGKETSIWAKRERALAWLDARRRHIGTFRERNKTHTVSGQPQEQITPMPAYNEAYVSKVPQKEQIHAVSGPQKMFKGRGEPSIECVGAEEEEDLDVESMRKVYETKPVRWTVCKERWGSVCKHAFAKLRRNALESVCAELAERERLEEEEEEEEKEQEQDRNVEIEWEHE